MHTIYGALASAIARIPDDPDVWMADDELRMLVRLCLVRADGGQCRRHANRWWEVYRHIVRAYARTEYVGKDGAGHYYHAGSMRAIVEGMRPEAATFMTRPHP